MKAKIKLDTRRARKDGTYPVVIEVKNVTQIRFSTPYASLKENWDHDGFSKKEKDYKRKNIVLDGMLNKVEKFLIKLEEDGERLSDKKMREEISAILGGGNNVQTKSKYFIDYLDEFVAKKTNDGTRSVYATTRNKLLKFDSRCTFDSMDKTWLERFEAWMAQGMKVNAYAIHFRNIRAVFNYAIDEEYTTLYPFRRFTIKKEETRKRSLTVEQLRILRDYPCEEYQERYRDIFMLMFYFIGINAVDLLTAKTSALVNGRFEYKRAKTGKLYSIKVEPEAQAIIDKYKGQDFVLNIMDEYKDYKNFLHRMGIALKEIGETERKGLGGKKIRKPFFPDLSSYWTRHTWATIAAEIDIPKEVIAHALGHSWANGTVTDIYIRFDEKKVDEANRKVLDYLYNINQTE
jgi:site-specific recombinase XerD